MELQTATDNNLRETTPGLGNHGFQPLVMIATRHRCTCTSGGLLTGERNGRLTSLLGSTQIACSSHPARTDAPYSALAARGVGAVRLRCREVGGGDPVSLQYCTCVRLHHGNDIEVQVPW